MNALKKMCKLSICVENVQCAVCWKPLCRFSQLQMDGLHDPEPAIAQQITITIIIITITITIITVIIIAMMKIFSIYDMLFYSVKVDNGGRFELTFDLPSCNFEF